jgi:hypothetical protein
MRALHRFPLAFEAWSDSFGLRDVLLRWHTRQSLELSASRRRGQCCSGAGWYFTPATRA